MRILRAVLRLYIPAHILMARFGNCMKGFQGMVQDSGSQPFSNLFARLRQGAITRRRFIQQATALGMGISVARYCADAVSAQDVPADAKIPDGGTDTQERGAGGDVKIIQWQAPSHLFGLLASGDKDILAASLISEALMVRVSADGILAPVLITEVPTVENGLLGEDLMSVTYHLLPDIVWSDGEPFTAEDVRFTWQWASNPDNNAIHQDAYKTIRDIEVIDDLTAKITFSEPNANWSSSFTSSGKAPVIPRHILEGASQEGVDAFMANPIGTGPYKVESFSANDQVTYVINEKYREPNKPFFERVILKGGGDPASAARAVIQTGEYDFGWNLTVDPDLIKSMESEDNPGRLVTSPGASIESVYFNFSDPNEEVDGQRSEMNTPHPILSDPAVRFAISLAIDREKMANELYFGEGVDLAVPNIISGIPSMESPNTELNHDPEKAGQILDEAGWTLDGKVRKKDGHELRLELYTTVDTVRQKEQAVIKSNLEAIGFRIDITSVDSAIYFDTAAGNDQNMAHFYTDMCMNRYGIVTLPPFSHMHRWYAGPERENIAQKSNNWSGENRQRYINDEYDAVFDEARGEADVARSAELFVKMNDILIEDSALVPLVSVGSKTGLSKRLREENIGLTTFEFSYWNIANWNLADGAE